jgi:Polyketide cyclase / dehydrase and lipid transport
VPPASHTVRRSAQVSIERLFDTVVAEDVLPKVLHRWGPVPAVVGTRDLSGPWDTPGSQRTVLLGDGSTASEQVLSWERPARFEYRADGFTSALGRLVDHALGQWRFTGGSSVSSFEWTYTFHPSGRAAGLALAVFVPTAWARYMAQCADLSVQLAERG